MKLFKCIHCLCVSIGWDDNMPYHISNTTRDKIAIVVNSNQELVLSHDEMENICCKILPKGVKAKSLLPGRLLNKNHTHIIVEILKPANKYSDFSYPILVDIPAMQVNYQS